VLNQPNLIRAKGRTPSSSPNPHQKIPIKFKFALGDGRSKGRVVFGDKYLLMVGQVRWL
jgi:hypothetical protein